MPFGDYADFAACVAANQDKENPEAYCAELERKISGEKSGAVLAGPIIHKSEAKRIATAPVLVPGEPDSDGEIIEANKIEDVALKFMQDYRIIDAGHTLNAVAVPVESWITRTDEHIVLPSGEALDIPKGTWMMSVKVTDDAVWNGILDGRYSGLSVTAVRQVDLESAMKSQEPRAELQRLMRKRLIADLGPDWIAAAVSVVEDPAVIKSKWIAIKSKTGGESVPTAWDRIIAIFKNSKEEDNEMDETKVQEMIDASLKSALEPFGTLNDQLAGLGEAVKSIEGFGDRLGKIEIALKEKEPPDPEPVIEPEGDQEPTGDAATKEDIAKVEAALQAHKSTLENVLALVTKGRSIGSDNDGTPTGNPEPPTRDAFGRKKGLGQIGRV